MKQTETLEKFFEASPKQTKNSMTCCSKHYTNTARRTGQAAGEEKHRQMTRQPSGSLWWRMISRKIADKPLANYSYSNKITIHHESAALPELTFHTQASCWWPERRSSRVVHPNEWSNASGWRRHHYATCRWKATEGLTSWLAGDLVTCVRSGWCGRVQRSFMLNFVIHSL